MFNLFPQTLSVFPQLLDYGFFAPLILRLASGLCFLAVAYNTTFTYKNTTKDILKHFPWLKGENFWIGLSGLLSSIIAIFLILGLYTQIMAILAILAGIKLMVLKTAYKADYGFDSSACILLIAIGLALLVAGPGALAIDLPL